MVLRWHKPNADTCLQKQYPAHSGPVVVHLIDAEGLCAGGSGAAAGLLHPTTPKGKVYIRYGNGFRKDVRL